ncbi:hypothetical protein Z949_1180 [Sulfitobacter guttiformis KCTC 32187]|nr:hypothetical protein Z949_1180 [Sulfitobacter guttiformis KCTC 32187]
MERHTVLTRHGAFSEPFQRAASRHIGAKIKYFCPKPDLSRAARRGPLRGTKPPLDGRVRMSAFGNGSTLRSMN